jgi:PhnB protein
MAAKPIPDGFHTVTPYLVVQEVDKVIDFVKRAFAAQERFRHLRPDGKTGHAEVTIGNSILMLGEAPEPSKTMPGMLYLYVNDADATYKQAVAAGGKSIMEPTTMFYGDRSGAVADPCGNQWWIATHVEDVTPEEVNRRAQAQGR